MAGSGIYFFDEGDFVKYVGILGSNTLLLSLLKLNLRVFKLIHMVQGKHNTSLRLILLGTLLFTINGLQRIKQAKLKQKLY